MILPFIYPNFSSNHIIHFAGSNHWRIVGTIDTNPLVYANKLKFILNVEQLEKKDTTIHTTGKVRVTIYGQHPDLARGDNISFAGKIKPIKNFNNPGGFDYKRYMAFKDIRATSYARGDRIKIIGKKPERSLQWLVEKKRKDLNGLIDKIKNKDTKAILKALLIGDKNEIRGPLREAFYRAGAGHILAISGLHIGIVATASFLFFSWLLSVSRYLLREGLTKKSAAVLSLVPVFVYGLISGMSPSTQRAVIMTAVFMSALLVEKEYDLINTLAVSAMLILVVFPPSLFSISFQLSFVAVFSIAYGFSKIKHGFLLNKKKLEYTTGSRILNKLTLFLITSVLLSLFAIFGTLPFVMFYFNRISFAGVISNVIVVPLIGFIVIPLGLISVFLSLVSLSSAAWCISLASVMLEPIISIVNFIAKFPYAAFKTVTPSCIEIGCYYVLIWAVLNIVFVKTKQEDVFFSWRSKKMSAKNAAVCIGAFAAIAMAVDGVYWISQRYWNSNLKVTVFDVGQGNCALIELPKGYCMLVDGGGFSDNTAFDVGEKIVAPLLWRKKIKTIETLVLSHPNSDHLNGLLYIASHFNVKNIWTNSEPVKTFEYLKLQHIIEEKNINAPLYKQLVRKHVINGVGLEILYPVKEFVDKKKHDAWRDLNNNSLVIKISFGSKSFLFPGDIEVRAERELSLIQGEKLESTVLLAPHHGSKTSSSSVFIESVKPEYVIISSGAKSRFNHPHPSVVNRYKNKGCSVLCTDEHGAVVISTDGQTLDISTVKKKKYKIKNQKNA